MRGLPALALATALLIPLPLHAKNVLQGQLALSLAWTDNVLSVPYDPLTGTGPESDFYSEIRPSLIFTTGESRFIQRLAYVFTADLFARHPEANSYANRLEWDAVYLASKRAELFLATVLSQGRLNTINLQSSSAGTPVTLQRTGGQTFVSAMVTEQLSWDLTPRWRGTQAVIFNSFVPIDPPNSPYTLQLDPSLAFEHFWRVDALGMELRSSYVHFSAVRGPTVRPDGTPEPDGVVQPSQDGLINTLVGRWRHDYGRFFSSQLDLGVVEANSLAGGGVVIWEPAGLAAIRYVHDYGFAELAYSHTVQPNAVIANTFIIDEAALRGGLPLGLYTNVALATTVAYGHARQIDFFTGVEQSRSHIILADATLSWAPRPELQIFARYQFQDQIGNPTDLVPQPTFLRHTVMIGAVGTYPALGAAVVPARRPFRVDRAGQPSFPAPHKPAPKY